MTKNAFIVSPLPLARTRHSVGNVCHQRPWSQRPLRLSQTVRMEVVEVGSVDEMETVLSSAGDSLVIVDYSTTWCGPCKVIAPVFEEMSDRYDDCVFVKVMGDATPASSELMKREGIRAVPAFHFWKNKKRVHDFTGAKVSAIEEAISEHR